MRLQESRHYAGILFCILFISIQCLPAQTLDGLVRDAITQEALPGVRVKVGSKGTLTDTSGRYSIPADSGTQIVSISYPGYDSVRLEVQLKAGEVLNRDFALQPLEYEVEQTVITGSRMEQKLAQMPVSTELISSRRIDQLSVSSVEPVLEQTPGITVQDGQPGIRGSSGYAYGAGSRVMIMLDGLPMLSGDAGFSQFDMLPVDNIYQVEVIKGASSVLYGSSALGGVINIRTNRPGLKPTTSIRTRMGVYDRPANPLLRFSRSTPGFVASAHLFHSRRIGNWDLTLAADIVENTGYRRDDVESSQRVILMTKYYVPKVTGLWFGLNASAKQDSSRNFLYWASYTPRMITAGLGSPDSGMSEGGLTPAPGTVRSQLLRRLAIDPSINYTSKRGDQHQYRGRILITDNQNDTRQNSTAVVYFNEYLYQRKWLKDKLTTSSGLNYTYSTVDADSLYGDHYSNAAAAFFQADYMPHSRWILNAGWRYQWVQIDKLPEEQSPVYRAGASYRIHKATYVRTSWGQGFRVPSIAERFTATTAGGIIVVPNPLLQNERGYSAELGIRQGFAAGKWKGFGDVAVFRMQFRNMIEFNVYSDSILKNFAIISQGVPFRSLNVSDARIEGYEITYGISGKIGAVQIEGSGGYTYTQPRDLNGLPEDSVMNLKPGSIQTFNDLTDQIRRADRPEVLKYRNIHMYKMSLGATWKNMSLTGFYRYASNITNIDQPLYLVVNDLAPYLDSRTRAYSVIDVNATYTLKSQHTFSFLVHNLWNEEYMIVPGLLAEQRRFTLQYKWVF
jgi:iron complex outermembrane receptor protein